MKRLRLHLDPAVLEFSDAAGGLGPFPYLKGVGDLIESARAGHLSGFSAGETPSCSVTLTNEGRKVAALIGRPLRALAEVLNLDGSVYFAGFVQSVTYGNEIELTVEA